MPSNMCFGIDVTIAIYGSRSIECPSFVQVCVGLCSLKLQVLDDQPRQQRGAVNVRLEGGYGDGPQLCVRLAIEAAAVVTVCVYVILAVALGDYRAVIVVVQTAAPPVRVASAQQRPPYRGRCPFGKVCLSLSQIDSVDRASS